MKVIQLYRYKTILLYHVDIYQINTAIFQGIVTGTGENSEFGEVFKLMKAEEVSTLISITDHFKPQHPHANSPNWSLCIWIKGKLRGFVRRLLHYFSQLFLLIVYWYCKEEINIDICHFQDING